MLIVDTYIDFSPKKGFGLFAKKDIPKGTKYWVRNVIFDKVFSPQQMLLFGVITVNYIKKYGFLEKSGNWYLCCDDARFSNHSENPNSENSFDSDGIIRYTFTSKDILVGEEILCDYREICLECRNNLDFIVDK